MTKQNYSFRLSAEKIAKLDKIGELDERDRTYMVDKAIDLYLKTHAEKNGAESKPASKKKAGIR